MARPRVYAVAGAAATWSQAVAAAAYSLRPGVWVSHRSAGRLWGFPGVDPEHIDVLVAFERRVRMAGVRSHRTHALFTADLTRHVQIPVTSPERTLVDLPAAFPVPVLRGSLTTASAAA